MASLRSFLDWPFFDESHRELAGRLRDWAAAHLIGPPASEDRESVDNACRQLVRDLGRAGWTRYCAPGGGIGNGAATAGPTGFDVRALALIRETLAHHDALADFAFAMQGLGSGAISLAGSPQMRARYLPRVAAGEAIAAFALSEPEAGSDVAALRCRAARTPDGYELEGEKTWISNGGIADFYCVFARTTGPDLRPDGTTSADGITAFVVDAATPGLSISRRIDTISPHPLAALTFHECRVPLTQRLGAEGEGFKIAMRTLDVFRASVAGAAVGFAQRALNEALAHAAARKLFGKSLADFQLTQAALADMATGIDAARLLTYRAAWLRDRGERATAEVAMAKMTATETAQQVIDRAVQLFGGRGVARGEAVERLYRDIRALRIYEGATEVQKLIIGRELIRHPAEQRS
ncbi:MAG: acyl-CoA dehydrogenase family protein [Gammaproteobacteria bacterium]|nr:acyl-CoA dehydrogenase family protein [Gammaproteobacteria bacterium]MDE2262722.1 acyl-CoA dehydrogenase family protein [Gammaproteobacteria bacterium]